MKISDKKLKIIKDTYNKTKSIYQAAKEAKVQYITAKRHIYNIYNIIGSRIDNSKKDNNKEYIDKYRQDVITENSKKNIKTYDDNLDPYYLKTINLTTKRLFRSLNKNIDKVTPSKIPLCIGIFLDKRNQILTRDKARMSMNTAIFNFFMNTGKVKELVAEIREDKSRFNNVIDMRAEEVP